MVSQRNTSNELEDEVRFARHRTQHGPKKIRRRSVRAVPIAISAKSIRLGDPRRPIWIEDDRALARQRNARSGHDAGSPCLEHQEQAKRSGRRRPRRSPRRRREGHRASSDVIPRRRRRRRNPRHRRNGRHRRRSRRRAHRGSRWRWRLRSSRSGAAGARRAEGAGSPQAVTCAANKNRERTTGIVVNERPDRPVGSPPRRCVRARRPG